MEFNLKDLAVFFWLLAIVMHSIVEWQDSGHHENPLRVRLARIGIFASFLIGLATLGLEILKQQDETKKEAKTTQNMVAQIQRVLGKMEVLRVSFRISIPATHPELKRYRNRIVQEAGACFPEAEGSMKSTGLGISSLCFPKQEEEPVAYSILSVADVCLDFFKEPIAPESYEPCQGGASIRPALAIKILTDLEDGLDLEFDSDRQRFVLQALNRESRSWSWRGNAAITSTNDLIGAQMFLSFTNLSQGFQGFEGIYKAAEIDSLSLDSGIPSIDVDLSEETMTRLVDVRGTPFYYTYFSLDPSSGEIVASKEPYSP